MLQYIKNIDIFIHQNITRAANFYYCTESNIRQFQFLFGRLPSARMIIFLFFPIVSVIFLLELLNVVPLVKYLRMVLVLISCSYLSSCIYLTVTQQSAGINISPIQFQHKFAFLFTTTKSSLFIIFYDYSYLFIWLNSNSLHNFQSIIVPTLSYFFIYYIYPHIM